MQYDSFPLCSRLLHAAEHAGVSYDDCTNILCEYQTHMKLGDNVMDGARVRRGFHEAMLSHIRDHPEHMPALTALRKVMEEGFDDLVEHVVEPFKFFRVCHGTYTRWRILKEQQRVNWVHSAFLKSNFFKSLKQHGPRRPPNSKLIEHMYYLSRSHTPEGMAVSPVLREIELN